MDFGIAKAVEGGPGSGATATGVIVGTPEYMSPEQARGAKVDTRSDLYSLGIVVFEIFTGGVPFRGDTPVATILQHLQQPPPLGARGRPACRARWWPAPPGARQGAGGAAASAREIAEALRAAWGERAAQGAVTPVSTPTLSRAGALSREAAGGGDDVASTNPTGATLARPPHPAPRFLWPLGRPRGACWLA